MNSPKRVAPGWEIAGATKLRLGRSYAACRHTATRLEFAQRSSEQILRDISCLRVCQQPYGQIFWGIEEAISRLADELERRKA